MNVTRRNKDIQSDNIISLTHQNMISYSDTKARWCVHTTGAIKAASFNNQTSWRL